ncbi:hypothetical protein PoB_005412500 [Plakobranchus ocellatus]|uniref:Uncharacterized protein n=1 Tax=Plakobranchus ocellatus TaxID=259542 RepID=A0AAV4C7F5_9GAST|nr:hypothetical protein PoB_005412500 [Plakobranchus ocellatus]
MNRDEAYVTNKNNYIKIVDLNPPKALGQRGDVIKSGNLWRKRSLLQCWWREDMIARFFLGSWWRACQTKNIRCSLPIDVMVHPDGDISLIDLNLNLWFQNSGLGLSSTLDDAGVS